METFQNLGAQYLFFKIHLNLLTHKKTEQPKIRQPGYDGAGNPAILMKPLTFRKKIQRMAKY
jgi:hypothetical protein